MNFALCGAGRVGTSLAFSLKSTDWNFTGYYSKNFPEWIKEEEKIKNLSDIKGEGMVVILTLPDRDIESVSAKLQPNLIIGHTSGSLTHTSIKANKPEGRFSLHPLKSISSFRMQLSGLYWGIEGDKKGLEIARMIVRILKGKALELKAEKKPLYHMASIISSNLIVSLLYIAHSMFEQCNIESGENIEANLAESTIQNIRNNGFSGSLTGPVERGDYNTVERDLDTLNEYKPELIPLIIKLMDENLKLAKKRGLNNKYADIIDSIISKYSKT